MSRCSRSMWRSTYSRLARMVSPRCGAAALALSLLGSRPADAERSLGQQAGEDLKSIRGFRFGLKLTHEQCLANLPCRWKTWDPATRMIDVPWKALWVPVHQQADEDFFNSDDHEVLLKSRPQLCADAWEEAPLVLQKLYVKEGGGVQNRSCPS